jgi:hypothetical protein
MLEASDDFADAQAGNAVKMLFALKNYAKST